MTSKPWDVEQAQRLAREVERERRERALHDEQRAGLCVDEEFRNKDPRENGGAAPLKRWSVRK
ncbi:MAG TPA: hypothetical protein VF793_22830 [Telluria sp.]|jgi:hypothetical protein